MSKQKEHIYAVALVLFYNFIAVIELNKTIARRVECY